MDFSGRSHRESHGVHVSQGFSRPHRPLGLGIRTQGRGFFLFHVDVLSRAEAAGVCHWLRCEVAPVPGTKASG